MPPRPRPLGHGLGAAGAVEAALTVLTLRHRTVPPIANPRARRPGSTSTASPGSPVGRTSASPPATPSASAANDVVLAPAGAS
ncbi:hypothetical protein ACIF80_33590 [Streptomyces sp. NPDC085927]|uniref:hypothetical protein n=1 Tax=Streptomyces sp. NPDC085927 TaxID=3365738 RepID=UPI0037D645CB